MKGWWFRQPPRNLASAMDASGSERGDQGLELLDRVRGQGAGDVWLARSGAASSSRGERVVRRLEMLDAAARARAMLLGRDLTGLEHPGLVPVLGIRSGWGGLEVVQPRLAEAEPLADMLHRRRLSGSEAVGIGGVLAEALAFLHARGITHGCLTAADVLIGPGRSARLTGYGVRAMLGSGGEPVDDVRDLADLLLLALEEREPVAAVRRLLTEVADPQRTPWSAEMLAAELVRLAGTVGTEPHDRRTVPARPPRSRRGPASALLPTRGLGALAVLLPGVVALLFLAGWLGATSPRAEGVGEPSAEPSAEASQPPPAASGVGAKPPPDQRDPPTPTSTARSLPPTTSWPEVLNDLEVRREALFASPSEPAVAAIDAPGSSAYAYDMTAVRTLRARGAVARGVRSDFRSVVVHSAGPWRADLEVLEALRPHLIARPGAAGAADVVLERRPAPPPRHEVITLVRTDAGWRVAALGP